MESFTLFFLPVRTQEVEYIDPVTLKPDLYAAAVANNAQRVTELLKMEVPGTFIDTATGWTVSNYPSRPAADDLTLSTCYLASSLGCNAWKCPNGKSINQGVSHAYSNL
jgi:hypothetical protein